MGNYLIELNMRCWIMEHGIIGEPDTDKYYVIVRYQDGTIIKSPFRTERDAVIECNNVRRQMARNISGSFFME
jgi:hypothetical protein